MSYKKVLEVLQALPKDQRVLAHGMYVFKDGDCGCAVGKVMPSLYRNAKPARKNTFGFEVLFDWATEFKKKPRKTNQAIVRLFKGMLRDLKKLDCSWQEMAQLQITNDHFSPSNDQNARERRYEYVVAWLKGRVREEREAEQAKCAF
jgi:hypothetical protein